MNKAQFSDELHRLLPSESDKRIRAAIMLAYNGSAGVARKLKSETDYENRPKFGLLQNGTLTIDSATQATLKNYGWVIDYMIFQIQELQIPIEAPNQNFPRPDYFLGTFTTVGNESIAGVIYLSGSIDADGNAQFPTIPENHVLLASIIRNPDGTFAIDPIETDYSDFLKKSAIGNQTIESTLTMKPMAGTEPNFAVFTPNGTIARSRTDQAGIYSTTQGIGGYSKILTINLNLPGQVNYYASIQFDGVSQNFEKGFLWIQFALDTNGNMVANKLKCFGEMDISKYIVVKTTATTYELFIAHDNNNSFYKFRPLANFGGSAVYKYYQLEERFGNLPAGEKYYFTLYNGPEKIDLTKFGIEYGGQVIYSGTGLRYNLATTGYYLYTENIIIATNQFVELNVGDATHDRFDLLYLDINSLQKITGIPSVDPQLPSLPDPANNIQLTFILIKANATVPDNITEQIIYDENIEWNTSFSGSGTTNFNSTTLILSGTKSAEATNYQTGSKLIFTTNEPINPKEFETISLLLRLKASMNSNRNLSIRFFNGNTAVSSIIDLPIQKAILTTELIAVNMSAFQIFSETANKIEITYTGSGGPATFSGFYLDKLRLEKGILQVQPPQQAQNGWSAVKANIIDGQRVVQRIVDWIGGTGTKPPTGQYIGINGFVTLIADATNIKGPNGYTPQKGTDYFDGDDGLNGWTAIKANIVDEARVVQQVVDWTGGTGPKPTTGLYIGTSGFVTLIAQATNIKGANGYTPQKGTDYFDGDDGLNGWSAIKANIVDGERVIQQVIDWTGGTGTKPPTGLYIGPTGFVNLIAQATNIRGAQGPAGTGGGSSGGGSSADLDTFPGLKFDKNYRFSHQMMGPIEFYLNNNVAHQNSNFNTIYVQANGVNKPSFLENEFSVIWDGWNNTQGKWNRLRFEFTPEGKAIVEIRDTTGTTNPGAGAINFELNFDADYSFTHVINGTISLTVNPINAEFTKRTIFYFLANGINKPQWNTPIICNWDNYLNTAGIWNRFIFEWTPENKATLQIINT